MVKKFGELNENKDSLYYNKDVIKFVNKILQGLKGAIHDELNKEGDKIEMKTKLVMKYGMDDNTLYNVVFNFLDENKEKYSIYTINKVKDSYNSHFWIYCKIKDKLYKFPLITNISNYEGNKISVWINTGVGKEIQDPNKYKDVDPLGEEEWD